MGYVHKPIPPEILAKMPPNIRRQAIAQEREFLARVHAGQARTGGYGIAVLIVLAFIAAAVFFR